MMTATKIFMSQKFSKTRQMRKKKHEAKYSASIIAYIRSAHPFAACGLSAKQKVYSDAW